MKEISPVFNDDNDKIIVVVMFVLSIFCVCIPALVVMLLLKDKISENSYLMAKALFNFELLLFLISLIFVIPIIGWILGFILTPIMILWNTIVIVMALCAIAKQVVVKLPDTYAFV